jgi:rod shape-determining protein MreD
MALVLVTTAALQRGVANQLRIADVAVDLFLVVAVAGGLASGPDRGAIGGFVGGLVMDLLSASSLLGLTALAWCLVGWAVGRWHAGVTRSSRWVPVGVGAVAGAAAIPLWVGLAFVVGRVTGLPEGFWPAVAVSSVSTAVLVLPVLRVMRWVWQEPIGVPSSLR